MSELRMSTLVAPMPCPKCGAMLLPNPADCCEAQRGSIPIKCGCGAKFGIKDVSQLTFYERDEWDTFAWDTWKEGDPEPESCHILAAFPIAEVPSCER